MTRKEGRQTGEASSAGSFSPLWKAGKRETGAQCAGGETRATGYDFRAHRLHIGLRTVKTGLAATIALLIAGLRDSAMPIIAVIGAIEAMSRTLYDSRKVCLKQFVGILLGCTLAYCFVTLLPFYRDPGAIGLGMIAMIAICHYFQLDYAISLSCVIFVSICLNSEDVLWYAMNRFVDSATGLGVGYAVNAFIKPYNNRNLIVREMEAFAAEIPAVLRERVAAKHYPDTAPLYERLHRIDEELKIYEQQPLPHKKDRREDSIYLRGCYQLAVRMMQELDALCVMDVPGTLSKDSAERLTARGIQTEVFYHTAQDLHSQVMNYHLNNLLDAYAYLEEMLTPTRETARQEANSPAPAEEPEEETSQTEKKPSNEEESPKE